MMNENEQNRQAQAAIDEVPAPTPLSPEQTDGDGDKKSKHIGMSCGHNSILAWNFSEGLRVRVSAERMGDNLWNMTSSYGDNTRMIATIFGGRCTVDTYARFMRNAIVSRCNKIRKNYANAKAKKAAMPEAAKEA